MRILTWNILAENWIEPEDIVVDRWARFQQILAWISRIDADIVALQEVEPEEYEILRVHMQEKGYAVSPATGLERILWYQDEARSSSGCTTFVRKGIVIDESALAAVSVHLEDASEQLRYEQLDTLLSSRQQGRGLLIVAGDFNQHYGGGDSAFYTTLVEEKHGMTVCSQSSRPTYCGEGEGDDEAAIDNILIRFPQEMQAMIVSTIPDRPLNAEACLREFGSDHLPVWVDIIII